MHQFAGDRERPVFLIQRLPLFLQENVFSPVGRHSFNALFVRYTEFWFPSRTSVTNVAGPH